MQICLTDHAYVMTTDDFGGLAVNDAVPAADICRAVAKDLKQRGYTQAKAAELMQIDPKAVANQISGKRAFGKKAARRFAQAFGYSEAFLLHGEGTLMGTPNEEPAATEAVILTQAQFQQLIQRIASLENDVTRLKQQNPAAIVPPVKAAIIPPVKVVVPSVKLASVTPRRAFQTRLVKPAAATAKGRLADSIRIAVNNVPVEIVADTPVKKGKGRR